MFDKKYLVYFQIFVKMKGIGDVLRYRTESGIEDNVEFGSSGQIYHALSRLQIPATEITVYRREVEQWVTKKQLKALGFTIMP